LNSSAISVNIYINIRKTWQNADDNKIYGGIKNMLSREQCLKEYGSDYYIQKKIESGELFRIDKGIYALKKHIPEIAVVSFKYPNAIVTMGSAFYLYGLTDVIPDVIDLATPRDAAKIKDKRVKQYFVSEEFFKEGIDHIDYEGYEISIYSKERMLVELLRYKSKLSFDYYKEVVLNYRKLLPALNIQEIQDLALDAPKSAKILDLLQSEVL
jgi:hypothetical protein